jgi:AcrR family transcriptional regulator
VLHAAVDELVERGIAGFSVNSVAARAEVDKRGIYLRWPERDQLIIDALGSLAAGLTPPGTASLRSDLELIMPAVAAVFAGPRLEILTRCIAEAREYPSVYAGFRRDSVDQCAAVVEDAFLNARTRGETADWVAPAQAADAFLGLILISALLRGDSAVLTGTEQRRIIDYTMATVTGS